MEDTAKNKKYSRRAFLETGVTGGMGVALGLAAGAILKDGENPEPETVKLLTADGKLVEVEKRLIPPMCGNPVAVSNQELKDWMEKEKL